MEYITLLLIVANLAIGIYALVRINALFVELRTPLVKKLSSDMNLKPSSSRRPVSPQDMANRSGNRDNRNNQPQNPNKDRQKDNRSDRPQQSAPAQQPLNSENKGPRENRDNRDGRDNRDRNRDGRDRNRDGRDNRDRNRDNRDRNRDRRPQEMMGNEVSEDVEVASPVAFTENSAPIVERPVSEGRPSFEGRRPLEPRFQAETPDAETAAPVVSAAQGEESSSETPEFDPSKMRHGRRSQMKKAPSFEEEASSAV